MQVFQVVYERSGLGSERALPSCRASAVCPGLNYQSGRLKVLRRSLIYQQVSNVQSFTRTQNFSKFNYMSIVPISRITLSLCDGSKRSQKFEFTYKKDVHLKSVPNTCWDFQGGDRQEIQQYPCHGQKGNQLFKYVSTTKIVLLFRSAF